MITPRPIRCALAMAACGFAFSYSLSALADDISTFATASYARGLQTPEMMQMIDTDGDGTVSRQEWIAYQEKVYAMLDKTHTGMVDAKQFIGPSKDLNGIATGGYATGLRTAEMMHKIDTDGDGTVSKAEFVAYQTKIFDMLDTSTTHKGMLGKEEMFATGGANTH